MRVLVTGAKGQLGQELVRELRRRGDTVTAADREEFDLTQADSVHAFVRQAAPEGIIHCAAYNDINLAETEPMVCCRVNAMGTLNMVRAALDVGARLLYMSSAEVLTGEGDAPQGIHAPHSPRNIYGLSKLQGEEAVRSLMTEFFVVRTGWLYGPTGDNLVRQLLNSTRDRRTVPVDGRLLGSPTFTVHLAPLLARMIHSTRYGVYHAANEGSCTQLELAREVQHLSGRHCRFEEMDDTWQHGQAHRPRNAALSMDSLEEAGFSRLPVWQEGLRELLRRMEW